MTPTMYIVDELHREHVAGVTKEALQIHLANAQRILLEGTTLPGKSSLVETIVVKLRADMEKARIAYVPPDRERGKGARRRNKWTRWHG